MVDQQVDHVPWTIQQTLIGISLTLVPWLFFVFALSNLSSGNPAHTPALKPQVDLANAIVTFILSSVIEGAFLIAPLYFANHAFHSIKPHLRSALDALGFRSFSFGRAATWISIFVLAILAVDNLYQFVITVLHLNLQTNDQVILARSKYAPITTYATLLAAVFVAPFCEEVFFRGFVFTGLRKRLPLGWAIILSAFLFGVAHGDLASLPVLFIIGLALAFLRWHTRSLWPGIILHTINNGLGAIAIILVMWGLTKP